MIARCLLFSIAIAAASAPARAQDPQEPPPGAQPGPPGLAEGEMRPAEIQKLFDAYALIEAQQALALSDQQYPQFLTRLRALQDARRRNQQERMQLMNQLQRLTNPRQVTRPDESMIKARLTALLELEGRHTADMKKAYAALDEVLDIPQQARFRVFEEMIERRKMELLMRARQQNRPPQPNQQRPNRPPPPQ